MGARKLEMSGKHELVSREEWAKAPPKRKNRMTIVTVLARRSRSAEVVSASTGDEAMAVVEERHFNSPVS